jgi:hypothetical protein
MTPLQKRSAASRKAALARKRMTVSRETSAPARGDSERASAPVPLRDTAATGAHARELERSG